MSEEEKLAINKNIQSIRKKAKRKKTCKVLSLIIIFLVAIGIGLYFGWNKLNTNPITIYKNGINDIYNNLASAIKKNVPDDVKFDIKEEPFVLDISADLTSNIKELSKFTGLNYKVNLGLDYQEKLAWLNLGIKEEDQTIINAVLSFLNGAGYFKSSELYEKTIKLGDYNLFNALDELLSQTKDSININADDLTYLLKTIKNLMINTLDKNKFEIEAATITIQEKEYNTKKVLYTLDAENLERTMTSIINGLKKDRKSLKILSSLTDNYDEDSIKIELENLLNNIDFQDLETLTIVLYANNLNHVLAGTIHISEEEILRFDTVNDLLTLEINIDDVKIEFKEEKDQINISVKENDVELSNIEFTKSDNAFKMNLELYINGLKVKGNLDLTNIKDNKSNSSSDFSFSLNVNFLGKNYTLKLDGTLNLTKDNISKIETDEINAIEANEISAEEMTEIKNKLQEILKRFNLTKLISM